MCWLRLNPFNNRGNYRSYTEWHTIKVYGLNPFNNRGNYRSGYRVLFGSFLFVLIPLITGETIGDSRGTTVPCSMVLIPLITGETIGEILEKGQSSRKVLIPLITGETIGEILG